MKTKKSKHRRPLLPSEESDSESWMLSYSDMMTLLLAFFVLLAMLSNLNPVKMQIVAKSLNRAMGGSHEEPVITLAQIQADLEKIIKQEGLQSQVEVSRDRHGVALSLKGSTFFASGSTDLLGPAIPFLTKIAKQINRVPYKIAIEGHTDNVPISSARFPSNWELSAARAAKVVRFFIERGVPTDRLRAIGYADTKPVNPLIGNKTEYARSRNRRVVIIFLDEVK